jgi:hypothetical protein
MVRAIHVPHHSLALLFQFNWLHPHLVDIAIVLLFSPIGHTTLAPGRSAERRRKQVATDETLDETRVVERCNEDQGCDRRPSQYSIWLPTFDTAVKSWIAMTLKECSCAHLGTPGKTVDLGNSPNGPIPRS